MINMNTAVMHDSPIAFPGLFGNWTFTASSKAINIGGGVYWYGIIIALGLVLAVLFCMRQKEKYGISEDNIFDCLLWGIPCGIIGARLYYVIFYLDLFRDSDGKFLWGEAIAVWDGGLAIYGGVIAVLLVIFFYTRAKKISFFAMTDLVMMGMLIGQAVGRWGNFMNREAFGAETDIFCRMKLTAPDGSSICVHPTFLYESLWNLVGFIALTIWERRGGRRYDGQAALGYFFWYGLGRAWIEGLRTDSLYIGRTSLRVSQLLSIVLCLTALVLLVVNARKKHPPEELYVNRVAAAEAAVIVNNQENTEEEQA